MAAKYTLKILTDFAAAHTLRDYPGNCACMHGHNWKVEAEVAATALDDVGMAIDFKQMKKMTNEVCDRLDHTYMNELEPFDTINPTAENIAAYLFKELGARLNGPNLRVSAITLWETDRACVRYTED